MINPERLIQMFREFGVAPTTIGVATVDDLMRFLNDELRSLQGVQPVHTGAQQHIPQINLQQFGISVAPTQTGRRFVIILFIEVKIGPLYNSPVDHDHYF